MSTLLRCVSHFSFLTGLLSPRELVELAVRQEMAHVGLCDWGGLYGHPLFAQEAARAGLHAVFGVELGEGRERVVVLARNTPGYRRLCRMVSGYRLAEGRGSG
jgi:DNA polymerase III alpha subunit